MKQRNFVLKHATILRKGGVHTKSRKSRRQQEKMAMKRDLRTDQE